jgi:hypothetical protein
MYTKYQRGQSIMEVLVAVTVGTIIVGSATGAIILGLQVSAQSRSAQIANGYTQELMSNLKSVSEGNWQKLYNLPAKGSGTQYYLATYKTLAGTVAVTNNSPTVTGASTTFTTDLVVGDNIIINSLAFTVNIISSDTSLTLSSNYSGVTASGLSIIRDFSIRSCTTTPTNTCEQVTYNNTVYIRYFSVQNVNRDACGAGSITTNAQVACSGTTGILEDPSTQQIIVTVSWPVRGGSNTSSATFTQYFSRTTDQVMKFIDWGGGTTTTSSFSQPTNKYTSQTGLNVSATGVIQLQ